MEPRNLVTDLFKVRNDAKKASDILTKSGYRMIASMSGGSATKRVYLIESNGVLEGIKIGLSDEMDGSMFIDLPDEEECRKHNVMAITGRSYGVSDMVCGIKIPGWNVMPLKPARYNHYEISLFIREMTRALQFLESRHIANQSIKLHNIMYIDGKLSQPILMDIDSAFEVDSEAAANRLNLHLFGIALFDLLAGREGAFNEYSSQSKCSMSEFVPGMDPDLGKLIAGILHDEKTRPELILVSTFMRKYENFVPGGSIGFGTVAGLGALFLVGAGLSYAAGKNSR
jgi:hypothetical protein